jgi:EAL domain-containing protein (putative c-di-GMP-specific phosphodiesterase class I)/DNA-binding response OmpR family regulator
MSRGSRDPLCTAISCRRSPKSFRCIVATVERVLLADQRSGSGRLAGWLQSNAAARVLASPRLVHRLGTSAGNDGSARSRKGQEQLTVRADAVPPSLDDEPPVVLVVEDDCAVRELFLAALERDGYRCLAASSGRAALEVLGQRHVDVVLLDRSMPGMTGDQVLRRLRSQPSTERVSVVMVTGDADLDSKIDGLGAGANDYLVKPVAMEELLARVAAQIEDRSRWNGHLEGKLATRARLSRELVKLPTELSLPQLETELRRLLTREFDLERLEIKPSTAIGRRAGESVTSVTVAECAVGGSSTLSRIPLPSSEGVLASLDVVTGRAQEDTVPALLDLAPQIASLLTFALRADGVNDDTQAWVSDVLADGGLRCVFQPIVSLDDRTTVGIEGLSRFTDGTAPDVAFRSATRAGVGAQLEAAAMQQLMAEVTALPGERWLSINVSAATLLSADLSALLASVDRPIVLEITEHEYVADYPAVRARAERLQNVSFAVDDAGAGYASLRHIFELQPDLVKLDRSWVSGVDTDPARQALIRGMVGFTDEIAATVIGEGIEREEEARTLASLGVPLGQGYLFGRPEAS